MTGFKDSTGVELRVGDVVVSVDGGEDSPTSYTVLELGYVPTPGTTKPRHVGKDDLILMESPSGVEYPWEASVTRLVSRPEPEAKDLSLGRCPTCDEPMAEHMPAQAYACGALLYEISQDLGVPAEDLL